MLGQAAQNVADFVKHGIIGRQCFGIAMGELGEFGLGALQSATQFQITGPIDRQEVGDRPLYNAQAVAVQAHVGDHLWIEQADRVAGHRVPKAGMEFLGHRRATDYRPGLADRYLQPRPGQIPGADQAVVATADDDRVPCISTRHHKGFYYSIPWPTPMPHNALPQKLPVTVATQLEVCAACCTQALMTRKVFARRSQMDRDLVGWKGYWIAAPTPFTEVDALNDSALRSVLRLYYDQGVHGVLVNGTTGE